MVLTIDEIFCSHTRTKRIYTIARLISQYLNNFNMVHIHIKGMAKFLTESPHLNLLQMKKKKAIIRKYNIHSV